MKKLLLLSSAVAVSFSLAGCGTMGSTVDNTARYTSSTVGSGIKYTTTTVGQGLNWVGQGVGSVVNTGVGLVGVRPMTYQRPMYYNGNRYMVSNGRYVRVY